MEFNFDHEHMEKAYLKNVGNFEILCDKAYELDTNANPDRSNRREDICSLAFAKIWLTSVELLKLFPMSSENTHYKNLEIWDISSLCVLTRSLIDGYCIFYYFGIDDVSSDELNFRFILWDWRMEEERVNMQTIQQTIQEKSSAVNPELERIRKKAWDLKERIKANPFYKQLSPKQQEKCFKQKRSFFITNLTDGKRESFHKEICRKAGINTSYYRVIYKYLSNYVHTEPFSIAQLKTFTLENSKSRWLFNIPIQCCVNFLSLSVRDYVEVFPIVKSLITKEIESIVEVVENSMMMRRGKL